VYDLAIHPGGSSLVFLAAGKPGQPGQLFRRGTGPKGEPCPLGTTQVSLRGLNFDAGGRLLTFITPDGRLGRWDWEKGEALPGRGPPAFQVALAPDGRRAATSTPDRNVVLLDLDAGRRVLTLPPEESDVWSLAWTPDGRRLAVSLADGGVALWDLDRVRARLAEFGSFF
jgi:WD40 repeat protein